MGIVRQAFGLQTLSEPAPEPEGPIGDYSANVTPASRAEGLVRNPLALPAFYRGVSVIVNMGSPMTLQAIRQGEVITSGLCAQPDPWMTRRRFFARTLVGLVLHGNAYWRKFLAADGTVTGLRCADRGQAYYDANGAVRYRLVFGRDLVDLPASQVEHIRHLEMPGVLDGLGPVQSCRVSLEGIAAVREYADAWFTEGSGVNGVLTTDQRLDGEDVKAYRDAWHAQKDGDRGGPGVKVLGSGLTYTPYFLSPKDAQWIEAQSWGVLDVARLLGIPGDYLLAAVEGSSLTYSNLEMIDTSFVKRTLLPDYLQPIEEALTNVLPRGQWARFDLADFLRPDAKTRAEIDAIYIGQKVYGPGYVQRRDNITEPATEES